MKKAVKNNELAAFLKGIAFAGYTVISITNPAVEVATNISSAYQLGSAIEAGYEYISKGTYIVEYAKQKNQSEDEDPELTIKNFAVAFTVQVQMTDGPFTGGYYQLIEAIADFEYLIEMTSHSFGLVGHALIAIPETPNELENLHRILERFSIHYALPDNSGLLHSGNMRQGNGFYAFLNSIKA